MDSGGHDAEHPIHEYCNHDTHVLDIAPLDADSDRLARIARHLHEDAHENDWWDILIARSYCTAYGKNLGRLDRRRKRRREIPF